MDEKVGQFNLYEIAQSCFSQAQELYKSGLDTARKCLSWEVPYELEPLLRTYKKVSGVLYDQVLELRSNAEALAAISLNLKSIATHLLGLWAQEVNDKATKVQDWSLEIRGAAERVLHHANTWYSEGRSWEEEITAMEEEARRESEDWWDEYGEYMDDD